MRGKAEDTMTNDQATALTLAHEALQLQHPTRNTSAAVRKEQALAAIDQALADNARQAPAPVEVSRLAQWRQWLLGNDWQPGWSTSDVFLAIADEIDLMASTP